MSDFESECACKSGEGEDMVENEEIDCRKNAAAERYTISRAEKYVDEHASAVSKKYRCIYHAMPPIGWMNDPNGFCRAFGKYHLFFQFHPYSAGWGPMHWGHYETEDFVKWKWKGVALAPDKEYDKDGCFSGSAIEKNGVMYLFYTAVKGDVQRQAVATSENGDKFKKRGIVIDGEKLPENCSRRDFRDPYVFLSGGRYYMICGSQATGGDGQILLFSSDNLFDWEFSGVLRKDSKPTLGIYECPCFCVSGGKDIIIASPQGYKTDDWRFENAWSSIYTAGKADFKNGSFLPDCEDEIDGGFNFYAPQVLTVPDGRVIMIAWMIPGAIESPAAADGWRGTMTLPREIELKNGKLYQYPVREIENYRKNHVRFENVSIEKDTVLNGVSGDKIELLCDIFVGKAKKVGVKIFESENNYASVYYDGESGKVVFDRSQTGIALYHDENEKDAAVRSVKVDLKNGYISFRIFLDVSCAEIFINGGERTMTGNVFTKENGKGVSFFADSNDAKIVSLEKYDIVMI